MPRITPTVPNVSALIDEIFAESTTAKPSSSKYTPMIPPTVVGIVRNVLLPKRWESDKEGTDGIVCMVRYEPYVDPDDADKKYSTTYKLHMYHDSDHFKRSMIKREKSGEPYRCETRSLKFTTRVEEQALAIFAAKHAELCRMFSR